jgi:hypothetical protein
MDAGELVARIYRLGAFPVRDRLVTRGKIFVEHGGWVIRCVASGSACG